MTEYCLCCGKPLKEGEKDYHVSCRKKFASVLGKDFDFEELIDQQIEKRETVPGVQKKISASFLEEGKRKGTVRTEEYIVKFPSSEYPFITEMENLCMNLAGLCRIPAASHTLYRNKDGRFFYLTKRMDREEGRKIPMEDFCQLSLRLTEDKYKGSYESFAALLDRYSAKPAVDKIELFYRLLFCFLTGNNDMHLKNFSLISYNGEYRLSPAYDLLNVQLINPKDEEETALTLNGKKKNLHKKDFLFLADKYGISEKVYSNLVNRFISSRKKMEEAVQVSLLSDSLKKAFLIMLDERLRRI